MPRAEIAAQLSTKVALQMVSVSATLFCRLFSELSIKVFKTL